MLRFIFVLLVIFIISCNNLDQDLDTKATFGPYRFRPRNGMTFRIRTTTEQEVSIDTQEPIRNKSNVEITTHYSVIDSSGFFWLMARIDSFVMTASSATQERTVDASTAANSPYPEDRLFAALSGARFRLLLDSQGRILETSGQKDIEGDLALRAGNDPILRKTAKQIFERFIDQKQGNGILSDRLPRTQIKAGATWQIIEEAKELQFNFPITCRFLGVKAHMGVFQTEGDFQISQDANQNRLFNSKIELKGTQVGHMEVDSASGMIFLNSSIIKTKGNVFISGKQCPVSIEYNISSRRI